MTALTLIGEPFPDCDAAAHAAAAHDLAEAVGITAPRGCSARLLVASDRDLPSFGTARARAEHLPLKSASLPLLWRAGVTARPLDGEFVHAITPLAALRSRTEDDGSQTSVLVPHALGWLAPELMGTAARAYRAFVKRAVRLADVVVTPTHATAAALQDRFGELPVQVLPLAPPSSYLRPADADARRAALGLPEQYVVTTATPGVHGRLEWLVGALNRDPLLPPLVVITRFPCIPTGGSSAQAGNATAEQRPSTPAEPHPSGAANGQQSPADFTPAPPVGDDGFLAAVPDHLRNRVVLVSPRDLADVGAILSGAALLAQPQQHLGAGYEVLGALAAGVPLVHGGCAAAAELALDATTGADTPEAFQAELSRILRAPDELTRLSVAAKDRSHSFDWRLTASLLWELHANI